MNMKFISISEFNYKAGAENLNFNDGPSATKNINDWISFATEKRIENFISEDLVSSFNISDNIVLLINGVSFDAEWAYGFDKKLTRSHEFTLITGKKVYRNFMHTTRILYYRYSCKLKSRIIRLPYAGNKYSMIVILPFQTDKINEVLTFLSDKELREEIQDLKETNVRLTLPKFQIEVFVNLNEAIKRVSNLKQLIKHYSI